ncbi:hypothetical protein PR048_010127 [Dryococelus australis]|uniref:Uncharacterized protein n=1 Tax=Dryococelus australis TaxID=614101 RepID=A0ABQ9I3R8_9NEOP|nr:hypothetical protein PR048_010127 [Dryococelus australis]
MDYTLFWIIYAFEILGASISQQLKSGECLGRVCVPRLLCRPGSTIVRCDALRRAVANQDEADSVAVRWRRVRCAKFLSCDCRLQPATEKKNKYSSSQPNASHYCGASFRQASSALGSVPVIIMMMMMMMMMYLSIASHFFERGNGQLYLSNDNVACLQLSADDFLELEQLEDLRLENNRLRSLNGSLLPLRSLRYLNVSNNQLTEFSLQEIRGLKNIRVLDLSYNSISQLAGQMEDIRWISSAMWVVKGGGNEIPEKTRRTASSSSTMPTCENPVTRPGIEPRSPWWKANVLIAQPPWPHQSLMRHGLVKICEWWRDGDIEYVVEVSDTSYMYQVTALTKSYGAAVAHWLGRSPPTTAIRTRSPAGSLPDSRMWESCWTMAACRRALSGHPRFPHPCIPAPFHPRVSFHVTFGDDGYLSVPNLVESETRVLDLKLEHNNIHSLAGSLTGLHGLRKLSLSHNGLQEITPDDLIGLDELRFLDISNNHLSTLEETSKTFLPSLERLIANNNFLTTLDKDFHGLPALCYADLSNNLIEVVGSELASKTHCRILGVVGTLRIEMLGNPIFCTTELAKMMRAMNNTKLLGVTCPTMEVINVE